MAVAGVAAGTNLTDTANVASYATASWTPTTGRLILVAVCTADALNAVQPTLSGNSLTYDLVVSSQRADGQRRVSVFRAWSTSPSAGAITIDYAGDPQQGTLCHISEFSGSAGSSSDNGSAAIVQAVADAWTGTANPVITLAAFGDANNGAYAALNHGDTMTAGAGWTQLADNTHATPNSEMLSEWRATADTTADVTALTAQGCGVAFEVALAPTSNYNPAKLMVVTQVATMRAGLI